MKEAIITATAVFIIAATTAQAADFLDNIDAIIAQQECIESEKAALKETIKKERGVDIDALENDKAWDYRLVIAQEAQKNCLAKGLLTPSEKMARDAAEEAERQRKLAEQELKKIREQVRSY